MGILVGVIVLNVVWLNVSVLGISRGTSAVSLAQVAPPPPSPSPLHNLPITISFLGGVAGGTTDNGEVVEIYIDLKTYQSLRQSVGKKVTFNGCVFVETRNSGNPPVVTNFYKNCTSITH